MAIDIRDGFNLFVQLNGGKLGGIPIEMIYADDQQNPDTGEAAHRKVAQARPRGFRDRHRVQQRDAGRRPVRIRIRRLS